MLRERKITRQGPTRYATKEDFCRIFRTNMNRLYLLSFLLTGNHHLAERCFVRGLEDSAKGPVFQEWAQSWARRTIIRNAIQVIRPRAIDRNTTSVSHDATETATIAAVVELPAFDRFVFVMAVLEGYSDQECSLFLDCTRDEVIAARSRALQKIGSSTQILPARVDIGSNPLLLGDYGSVDQGKVALPAAISA
jgi:DNA-directed RNA polymerase specialized sigma24 family protein